MVKETAIPILKEKDKGEDNTAEKSLKIQIIVGSDNTELLGKHFRSIDTTSLSEPQLWMQRRLYCWREFFTEDLLSWIWPY
jgi:hypothetical protein